MNIDIGDGGTPQRGTGILPVCPGFTGTSAA
jgi:hypothetical protein